MSENQQPEIVSPPRFYRPLDLEDLAKQFAHENNFGELDIISTERGLVLVNNNVTGILYQEGVSQALAELNPSFGGSGSFKSSSITYKFQGKIKGEDTRLEARENQSQYYVPETRVHPDTHFTIRELKPRGEPTKLKHDRVDSQPYWFVVEAQR